MNVWYLYYVLETTEQPQGFVVFNESIIDSDKNKQYFNHPRNRKINSVSTHVYTSCCVLQINLPIYGLAEINIHLY